MDPFVVNGTRYQNDSNGDGGYFNPELDAKKAAFSLFHDIMTYVILFIGIPGNVLAVVVMSSPRLRTAPFSLYLAALASADTVFLLTSVGLQIFHDHELIHASDVYCKLTKFLVRSSGYLSAWITTAFTVERYIAVCHPMRRSTLCTMATTKKVLFGLAIVVCSVSCLEFWAQVERNDRCEFRDAETWLNITIYDMAVGRLIPTAAVGVLNTIIAITVLRKKQHRRTLSVAAVETEKRQHQVTIVLFTVSTTFFVLTVPQSIVVVYDLASSTMEDIDEHTFFQKEVIARTLGLMFKLNFAINFILYSLTGRRFREVLVYLCHRCLPASSVSENRPPSQSVVLGNLPDASNICRLRKITPPTLSNSDVIQQRTCDKSSVQRAVRDNGIPCIVVSEVTEV